MTLMDMLKSSAERFPDRAAIVGGSTVISYADLLRQSRALTAWLVSTGLRKGDRVGLLLKKTPEAVISFLGVAGAGGVAFPINGGQPVSDIQSLLDLLTPAAIILDVDFLPLLSRLELSCGRERMVVVGGGATAPFGAWNDIVNRRVPGVPNVRLLDDDVVYLNITSGTTGIPKAAITTHANIYWNTRSAVECLSLTPDDVHLIMFPVFVHPHELFARSIYLGGTTVLLDTISPAAMARAIEIHRVTCLMAVASICSSLVRSYRSHPFNATSLHLVESGGMHVNAKLAEEFMGCLGVPIRPVWGSTETTGIAVANYADRPLRPGSMGQACPYYEVQVVRDDGTPAATDEAGEMVIKGPAVCAGYLGNPGEAASRFRDGWFHTSDIVRQDGDGFFCFVGRRHGMMKVSGLKVFPLEIENVLNSHPDIQEAAVVSQADRTHGEVPKAVIVRKPGSALGEKDVRQYCESRLSKSKVPRVISFVDELPKGPGGKVLYRLL